MRATMKVAVFITAMVLASFGLVWGQAVTLDSTVGLNGGGYIDNGATLSFYIGLDNNFAGSVPQTVINNGFSIESADGVSWGSTTIALNEEYCWGPPTCTTYPFFFDNGFFPVVVDGDGTSPDVVGFGGVATWMTGLPADFDDTGYWITIGPIDGEPAETIVLDSSYFPPMGVWEWDTYQPSWDGPHTFQIAPELDSIWTRCLPQPTILKQIELVLEIQIIGEPDPTAVDLESIRVQGKIPPYEPAVCNTQTGIVSTYAFIMRFLGASGFRPVTGDFDETYTVDYTVNGVAAPQLTGAFSLIVYPGNVLIDDAVDINDVVFMCEYMFKGGDPCPLPELMDVNKDGETSIRDIKALIELIQ
jgi:hypothetical protein